MVVRGFHKKNSKRLTTRKRTKIDRKVREHNKKLRKEAKKQPNKFRMARKDPGVPNSLPFKQEILDEAKRQREQREKEKEEAKQKRKDARFQKKQEGRGLADLAADAETRTAEFEEQQDAIKAPEHYTNTNRPIEQSRKAYCKEFKKVIESADVILEVLDARDPLGSRCPQVEQAVFSSGVGKKLVLVLNKIDLVPKSNVEEWLKYLRNELPTVAFKSSTQESLGKTGKLSRVKVSVQKADLALIKSSTCLGAETLMKLISNYSRSKDLKTAVRVGVVGFPNTGKSSLINSLKRTKSCQVGNTPGVTKVMQSVQLDKNVQLIDCPGVVMATGGDSAHTMLRNAVKVEKIEDPIKPIELLLSRCRREQMMIQYKIPAYTDTPGFLSNVAKRFGKVKKGGIPDMTKAACLVLNDWNSGKITYYTVPPENYSKSEHVSSEIISNMSAEFNLDDLLSDEGEWMQGLKSHINNIMVVDQTGPTEGQEEADSEEEGEVMDMTPAGKSPSARVEHMDTITKPKSSKKKESAIVVPDPLPQRKVKMLRSMNKRSPGKAKDAVPEEQMNKQRKKVYKKLKKDRKRAEKIGTELSDALESGLSGI